MLYYLWCWDNVYSAGHEMEETRVSDMPPCLDSINSGVVRILWSSIYWIFCFTTIILDQISCENRHLFNLKFQIILRTKWITNEESCSSSQVISSVGDVEDDSLLLLITGQHSSKNILSVWKYLCSEACERYFVSEIVYWQHLIAELWWCEGGSERIWTLVVRR